MLAIWNWSTGYRILGLLHILSAIVAFGPLFLYPSLQRAGAADTIAKLHLRLSLPALVLVWVFGMGLVGTSEEGPTGDRLISMSDGWIVASLLIWVALVLVSWFLVRPSLTDAGEQARSKLAAGLGITHLLMVVVVYLMVFKPGSGGL